MVDLLFNGLSTVAANLLAINAAARTTAGKRLYQFGEAVMAKSKSEYVPVDTGTLRSSGHVSLPFIGPSDISVQLRYGGPAASYAVKVHEDLTVHHGNGQAKYLERPVVLMAPQMAQFIGTGLLAA